MRISIVTASFNSADTLADCLGSVAVQSVEADHILVDGNFTDSTHEVIKQYRANLAHVVSETDQGMYEGMNKGIALADGDIVGILNADDVYASDRVLDLVASAFKDSEIGACNGGLQYVNSNDHARVVRHWRTRSGKTVA